MIHIGCGLKIMVLDKQNIGHLKERLGVDKSMFILANHKCTYMEL
jgi:hypothetical protein